jgi:superfamily II DNA or RNA helicase
MAKGVLKMISYSRIVDSTHIFLPKAEIQEDIGVLRRRFTIVPKFDNLAPVPVYRETKDFFGIPRHYRDFRRRTQSYEDRRSDGLPISFSLRHGLRARQEVVLSKFHKALEIGTTGFLVVSGTGTGKTVMALNMLAKLGRTALVVVPREHIVEQWIERILEHTSLTRDDIGIVQQDRCEYEGKAIAIGMIHSLARDKYTNEFKRWPGALVIDEVHVTGAETFSKVVSMFPSRYRIGLSATPKRQDGMEVVFQMAIAEAVIEAPSGTDVIPKVAMVAYDKPVGGTAKLQYVTQALSRRGVLISALASDFRRNVLIASLTAKTAKSGRRVLVLSDRKNQLEVLKDILTATHGFDPFDVGIFTQETPESARPHILKNCQIILATYGMMSMAVDVPDLSGLVFATPQSQVTQSVGRVLRQCSGKKDPVVIDIVDTSYAETTRWARKRERTYTELGAPLVIMGAKTAQAVS